MRSFCEKLLQPMLLDHRWIPPRRRLIPWLRNRTDTSLTSSVADLLLSRLCLDDGYGGTISTGKTKKLARLWSGDVSLLGGLILNTRCLRSVDRRIPR